MCPINVGGDDSVRWDVNVRNARYADVVSDPKDVPDKGKGRYRNIGVEDTGRAPYLYRVTIKIPRGGRGQSRNARTAFAASLLAAAKEACDAANGKRVAQVSFYLPVEDKAHGGAVYDQIRIDWNAYNAAGVTRRGAGRKRAR
jgi:hypothetical protein